MVCHDGSKRVTIELIHVKHAGLSWLISSKCDNICFDCDDNVIPSSYLTIIKEILNGDKLITYIYIPLSNFCNNSIIGFLKMLKIGFSLPYHKPANNMFLGKILCEYGMFVIRMIGHIVIMFDLKGVMTSVFRINAIWVTSC